MSAELVHSVLSRQLDDLEPTLTRHGYRLKDLVEQFDAKPTEIKALFSNTLDPARAVEWHCCKVSDEAAFCLIQRPYISKTLLTRRISPRGSP